MALKGEIITDAPAEKTPVASTSELEIMSDQPPVLDVEKAVEAWNNYLDLCKRLLDSSDYQKYEDKDGAIHEFPKKSAWFKLGKAFNVDTEIIEKSVHRSKTGRVQEAYYRVRAWLPNNGRTVEADASCDIFEKGRKNSSGHDLRATAETRATNRAIAKLIGAGEVSSDEINSGDLTKIK